MQKLPGQKGLGRKRPGQKRWFRERWSGWASLSGQKSSGPPAADYEQYRLSLREWLLYGGQGMAAAALIAYTFYRSITAFVLFLPLAAVWPQMQRQNLRDRRLHQLNMEFKEAILLLSANLSAGYSIENALSKSQEELELIYDSRSIMVKELSAMSGMLRLNRPVEQVLFDFAARSGLEDVRNFAQVFQAAKRSGGDMVSIIHQTAEMIRDKCQVREEILTLTAAKRFEQSVMNGIPFLIIFYVDLTSPGFFAIMYETIMGRAAMTVCLGVYLFAYYLSKRILAIPI